MNFAAAALCLSVMRVLRGASRKRRKSDISKSAPFIFAKSDCVEENCRSIIFSSRENLSENALKISILWVDSNFVLALATASSISVSSGVIAANSDFESPKV